MSKPEPDAPDEMRALFQGLTNLFGNVKGVIEQELEAGKLNLA